MKKENKLYALGKIKENLVKKDVEINKKRINNIKLN